MKLAKSILCGVSVLGIAVGSAFANQSYVEPSTQSAVPMSPDESGRAYPEPSQANEIQAVFNRFDADGNGTLTYSEAQADPNLAYVFRDGDVDGNGLLSLPEFAQLAQDSNPAS